VLALQSRDIPRRMAHEKRSMNVVTNPIGANWLDAFKCETRVNSLGKLAIMIVMNGKTRPARDCPNGAVPC
jgi:hypothetical protein